MKCPSCQGEWTPPKNVILSKCPFCQIDILMALNEKIENPEPEIILFNMLQVYGFELLQDELRLTEMIDKLFAQDPKGKKILIMSIEENIPQLLAKIIGSENRDVDLQNLRTKVLNTSLFSMATIDQMFSHWCFALEINKPMESFEIVWNGLRCGFKNSKGEMITLCKYNNAKLLCQDLAAVEINRKWSLINKQGEEIIPFKYENIDPFNLELARVEIKGKFGLINKTGLEVISCSYGEIEFEGVSENVYKIFLKEDGKESWEWHGKSGYLCKIHNGFQFFRPAEFVEVSEDMAPIREDRKFGFINLLTGELIPCIYNHVASFIDGLALVCFNYFDHESDDELRAYTDDTDYWGFIDKTGQEIIKCKYSRAYEFSCDLAAVGIYKGSSDDQLFGFIDREGNEVIPFKYDGAGPFIDGLALVSLKNKWGSIDTQDNEYMPFLFDYIDEFLDGLARAQLNGKWGFIDKSGYEVVKCRYDKIESFNDEDLFLVYEGKKCGLINRHGKVIASCKFDDINVYNGCNDLLVVEINKKRGLINRMNEIIIPTIYDVIFENDNELNCVKLDNRFGLIDNTGNIIVPCKYDHIDKFYEDLAIVCLGKKYGFIDIQGNEKIPCKYDLADKFLNEFAIVKINGKYGMIDKLDNVSIPLLYDTIYPFKDGISYVYISGKGGLIDRKGKEIVPCIYDWIGLFGKKNTAVVVLDEKYGFIDKQGNLIIPIQFDVNDDSGNVIIDRTVDYLNNSKPFSRYWECKLRHL